MIYFGLFSEIEYKNLKKSVIFYSAISAKNVKTEFDLSNINNITKNDVRTSLKPVLRKKENIELNILKKRVKKYTRNLLKLEQKEKEFLQLFKGGQFQPELLFGDENILDRIKEHPMAIWRTRGK